MVTHTTQELLRSLIINYHYHETINELLPICHVTEKRQSVIFLKISPTCMKAPIIFLQQSQENNWFLDISDYFLGTQTRYNTSMEI